MASKYQFSPWERWAVYTVHGEQCYLEKHPIDFKSMQVDHIIPESLLDEPERLKEILHGLGLPDSFELNSYENWLPACGPHNNEKRNVVFDPVPRIRVLLQQAAKKAPKARSVAERAVTKSQIANALSVLERAAGEDKIDLSIYRPLFAEIFKIREEGEGRIHVDGGITEVSGTATMDDVLTRLEGVSLNGFVPAQTASVVLLFMFVASVYVFNDYISPLYVRSIAVAGIIAVASIVIFSVVSFMVMAFQFVKRIVIASLEVRGADIRLAPNITISYADAQRIVKKRSFTRWVTGIFLKS